MPARHRGDIVQLETYFQMESKLSARREWVITDATSGARLGVATRWDAAPLHTVKMCQAWSTPAGLHQQHQEAPAAAVCSARPDAGCHSCTKPSHGCDDSSNHPTCSSHNAGLPAGDKATWMCPPTLVSFPRTHTDLAPLAPRCCSTWVAINLATRKLVRLPDEPREFFLYFEPKPAR